MAYRKDQGRMARMATFWSLAILLAYGCVRMRGELSAWQPNTLGSSIGGLRLPIVGLELSPALLAALAVFGLGMFFLHRYLETPKQADLLIETESELRKVSWPTLDETIDGSIVVVVVVVFLMAFMAGADFVLGQFFSRIILGGA